MTVHLLDVNVLIALLDPDHIHHNRAHAWFSEHGQHAFASCPFTQTAVPRILGNPRYPNARGAPASIVPYLRDLCALPGHVFWPADVNFLDEDRIDTVRLLDSAQITDSYLLALAVARNGKLATLDQRLVVDAVPNGADHLTQIP